ncbi:MAG TPA: glycosyltransferase family 4 protein [Methylomirabilota bacterium]
MPDPGLTHVTTVPDSLGFFRGQVDYMQERGFTVRAITSPGPDLRRFAAELHIGITAVEMPRRITPLTDVVAVRAMRRLLHQHRPAIVHAHTPKGGLLGLIAARSAAIPVRIYHMRGLPFTTARGWRRALLRQTERLSCRLATQVLCVSESVRAVAVADRLCDPARITVLGRGSGNGVDAAGQFNPDAFGPEARRETRASLGIREDALVVAFVGRIVRDKGVPELVEAWRSIREANERAHLLVIGPFEPKDPIPAETARAIRADPRVHLVGTTWEMPRWYAATDVVVLPTHREGFPNVVLEAGAMRLPVVATRVTGCVDAVEDGWTGILVPAGQAHPLASAIQTYLSDPALRRRHGAAGRRRVLTHFRPEAVWQALYLEYLRLLDQAGWARGAPPGMRAAPRFLSTSSGSRRSGERTPERRSGCS